jgi:oligoendopeptidase F
MGLDGQVRPWDAIDDHVAAPDPLGREPLRPFDTEEELTSTARAVFARVDSQFGDYFDRMIEARMLDLMSRPGKAPGAYCETFQFRGLPFILANSSGIANDVETLLHESGHAFHAFEAQAQPLIFQRDFGSEIAEVASMSMELLAAPYLQHNGSPGFYTEEEDRRERSAFLEQLLTTVPHIACVDAFQHWIYTSGEGGSADARDRKWLELRARFQRGVDWTGWESERIARSYEQIHIFTYPFYYIEYGLAQMGALQVWRNALSSQSEAVAAYRRALSLGSSRPLPELYAAAGAKLIFSTEEMAPLVDLVEGEFERAAAETR